MLRFQPESKNIFKTFRYEKLSVNKDVATNEEDSR